MKKPAYGVSINEVDYEKDNLVSFLSIFKPGRLIYCSFFHSFFHWFSSFFLFSGFETFHHDFSFSSGNTGTVRHQVESC